MSEEQKVELEQEETKLELGTEETSDTESTQEENPHSTTDEVAERAKSTGHLSAEEYKTKHGTLDGYKTEKEFVLTGELIDLKKTIQKRDKDIEAILQYQQTVFDQHKQKMRSTLEAQLRQAKEEGDVSEVEKLTAQRERQDIKDQTDQNALLESQRTEVLTQFTTRNKSWFNEQNPDLQMRVAQLDKIYTTQNPQISYTQLAEAIEKQMQYEMSQNPQYSHHVKTSVERPVLSGSNPTGNARSISQTDDKLFMTLSANEKEMFRVHKRIASKIGETVTVKEFLEQLKADGEL